MNGRRARRDMISQLKHGLQRKYRAALRNMTASHESAVRVAADEVAHLSLRTMTWRERARFWFTGHLPARMLAQHNRWLEYEEHDLKANLNIVSVGEARQMFSPKPRYVPPTEADIKFHSEYPL